MTVQGAPVTVTTMGIPVTIVGGNVAMLDANGKILSSEIHFGSTGDPAGPLGADGRLPSTQIPLTATSDLATQGANISPTTLFAVPANMGGVYRAYLYGVVTRAATTSSTLPNIGINWTDSDTNTPLSSVTVTSTNTANAIGAFGNGDIVINAKASTNIQFLTSNYATSGATSMQYAVHLRLEYIG